MVFQIFVIISMMHFLENPQRNLAWCDKSQQNAGKELASNTISSTSSSINEYLSLDLTDKFWRFKLQNWFPSRLHAHIIYASTMKWMKSVILKLSSFHAHPRPPFIHIPVLQRHVILSTLMKFWTILGTKRNYFTRRSFKHIYCPCYTNKR